MRGEGVKTVSAATMQLNRYLEIQVATATPERLVLMCFDGLVRFIGQALTALGRRDLEEAHRHFIRAQAIVTELKASLKPELGEIPARLATLYDFLLGRLVEANLRKDAAPAEAALRVATELRAAWEELCRVSQRPAAGAGARA